MNNAVFWEATLCGSCKNRCFGIMYSLYHQGEKNRRTKNNVNNKYEPMYSVSANVTSSLPILVTLMMEDIRFSQT
jgi:hypothetical protein